MFKNNLVIFFIIFLTNFSYSQQEKEKSILFIQSKTATNSFDFNTKLEKELSSAIIYIYTYSDLEDLNLNIHTEYFKKPIAPIAYEGYQEMRLYKNALPKKIDFVNFQRGIK